MDAQLLAEIAANPDDDAPRLVYADLLVQRGDPRGELIHLQIKQMASGNTLELQNRIDALLRAHGPQWKTEAGITGCLSNLFRGFPASLIGGAAEVLACRDALRTQPITSLSILSRLAGLEDLMRLPELAKIQELTIGGEMGSYGRVAALTTAQVEALARAPFAKLRTLHIEAPSLDEAGAQVLATAPWLAAIEKLVIGRNPLGSAGFAALAPQLRSLRHLALDDVALSGAGAAALAAMPTDQLSFVYLANARLGDEAVAFARSPVLATVHHLDLDRTYLGNAAAIALAASPHAAKLRNLALANCMIDASGARALAQSTTLAALARLDLRDNLLGHDGLAALAAGTGLPALRWLGVTKNGIGTGRYETYESPEYSSSYEVEETAEQIAARFTHRPGLVVE